MATKITIADLFPEDEGMILVARDAVDGSPRHISEVENGAACHCVCFGCGRRLVARNGGDPSIRAHSFAHRPEDVVVDCFSSGETALHIRAKEIIAQHRRVTLPSTSLPGLDGRAVEVTPVRSVDLTDVRLETSEGEVVPDVVATMPDGRRIFIEIANTHPCPPEKIEKLVAMGVEALEITVRRYRETPLDELDDIVLDLAPRSMLHSSERTAKAAEIADERRRIEDRERREAERLVAVYRKPPSARHRKAEELVEEMSLWGLDEFMDADGTLPSAFIVPRRQWQAALLYRLIDTRYPETVSPIDMVNRFKEREWTKPDLVYMTNEQSRKIAVENADFRSAYDEVLAYMRRLEKGDIVYQKPGKAFYMTHDFKMKLKGTLKALDEADANLEAIRDAYQAIDALVKPGGGQLPDFEGWLQQQAGRHGIGVRKFLTDVDLVHQTEESLREISQAIEKRANGEWEELHEDVMGLPIVGLVNRLMQAWEDARASDGDEWRAEMENR